jgi:DNA-binding PadR family transcriptional regulator
VSVRSALIGLLAQRPRHGYELRAAFEAIMGGEANWEVRPAQVYASLDRLAETGLIRQRSVEKGGGPEKRIYALTRAGRRHLRAWLEAETHREPERDEFFLKLMIAMATGEAQPRKMIQAQRVALFQRLHGVTTRRQAIDPKIGLAHVLLLDQAVMHLEADLHWLDMIEARLDEVRRQPLPQPRPRRRGRPLRASSRAPVDGPHPNTKEG